MLLPEESAGWTGTPCCGGNVAEVFCAKAWTGRGTPCCGGNVAEVCSVQKRDVGRKRIGIAADGLGGNVVGEERV